MDLWELAKTEQAAYELELVGIVELWLDGKITEDEGNALAAGATAQHELTLGLITATLASELAS